MVEGIAAARAVRAVAKSAGVETPIAEQGYAVLHEGRAVGAAVQAPLGRDLKPE